MANQASSQYAFGESGNQRRAFAGRSLERDLAFLRPMLRAGYVVADCGCGAGGLSIQVAEVVAPGMVFGFDQSLAAIEQANASLVTSSRQNVQFSIASVYEPGLENEAFDLVLFSGVLAHLSEPERALRQALALLKPGGLLAAIEPQKQGDWFGGREHEAMEEVNSMYVADFREVGADPFLGGRLKQLLMNCGFTEIEVTPGYSAALSKPEVAGPAFLNRVTEATFMEKTLRRGTHSVNELNELAQRIAEWRTDPSAVAALCECSALAKKPL